MATESYARVFYVYILFDLRGVPLYVGMGKGNRWNTHQQHFCPGRKRNPFLGGVVRRAVQLGKALPQVKVRERLTRREACETEIALIAVIGCRYLGTGPLANMSKGGDGSLGHVVSPQHRAAISVAQKGPRSLETRAKMRASALGKVISPETREKLSKAGLGKKHNVTPEGRARLDAVHRGNTWNLGNKRSAETKAKQSAGVSAAWANGRFAGNGAKVSVALIGRKLPAEHVAKIQATRAGYRHSEETKAKIRAANKGRQVSEKTKAKMRASRLAYLQREQLKED